MCGRIDLITAPPPMRHEVARAMMTADCGVFCSRADGWNLEALEMLSLGKTVVATDYSGHTEFLTATNARLVPMTDRERFGVGAWAAFGALQQEALVHHLRGRACGAASRSIAAERGGDPYGHALFVGRGGVAASRCLRCHRCHDRPLIPRRVLHGRSIPSVVPYMHPVGVCSTLE